LFCLPAPARILFLVRVCSRPERVSTVLELQARAPPFFARACLFFWAVRGMTFDLRTQFGVRFAAAALAFRAKVGPVARDDIDALEAGAHEHFKSQDPERVAIYSFEAAVRSAGRDEQRRAEAGDTLLAAIERSMSPEPPDLYRQVIYG